MYGQPTLAERARTALAGASAATMFSRDCRGGRLMTAIRVGDVAGGNPRLLVEPSSPAIQALAACPVTTLMIAGPEPYDALHVTGAASIIHTADPTVRCYRLQPLSVRLVGQHRAAIAVSDFLSAEPDPLATEARALLAHLEAVHAEELLAWVQKQGHPAVAVVPRSIDRYGLELAAITPDGVQAARIRFASGPIDSADLALSNLPVACDGSMETTCST